jgi:hypothetical protein
MTDAPSVFLCNHGQGASLTINTVCVALAGMHVSSSNINLGLTQGHTVYSRLSYLAETLESSCRAL